MNDISLKIYNSTVNTYRTNSAALSTRVAKPEKRLNIISKGIAISHLAIFAVSKASLNTNLSTVLLFGLL